MVETPLTFTTSNGIKITEKWNGAFRGEPCRVKEFGDSKFDSCLCNQVLLTMQGREES